MPLYALVEFSNMTVANVESRSSVLTAPNGFRNILEIDWAVGQIPAIGNIWDGQIPASFSIPVIPDVPSDLQGIIDKALFLKTELDKLIAGAGGIQGDPA